MRPVKDYVELAICSVIAFFPLAVANALQMSSVVFLPFSVRTFRAANTVIGDRMWSYWGYLIQKRGTEVVIQGDALPADENVILIANHQSMSDILMLICLAMQRRACGRMKWLVKDVIKYVPGVGWGMVFLECVFLKRDWAADETRIRATFSRLVNHKIRYWLMSFPEGTRLTPAKLAASQKFAKLRSLPPPKHVLLPRSKGFTSSVVGLRGAVDAVYSVTIAYHGPTPSLSDLILGKLKKATLDVRRVAIQDLPTAEADLAKWLLDDAYRKDAILERLIGGGNRSHAGV